MGRGSEVFLGTTDNATEDSQAHFLFLCHRSSRHEQHVTLQSYRSHSRVSVPTQVYTQHPALMDARSNRGPCDSGHFSGVCGTDHTQHMCVRRHTGFDPISLNLKPGLKHKTGALPFHSHDLAFIIGVEVLLPHPISAALTPRHFISAVFRASLGDGWWIGLLSSRLDILAVRRRQNRKGERRQNLSWARTKSPMAKACCSQQSNSYVLRRYKQSTLIRRQKECFPHH